MRDKLNAILTPHGITLGLSNEKSYSGTWEWFEKTTEEFRAGFVSAEEAYLSAAAYLKEEAGVDLPTLDEDGELIDNDSGTFDVKAYQTQQQWDDGRPQVYNDGYATLDDAKNDANGDTYSDFFQVVIVARGEHSKYEDGEYVFERFKRM